MNIKRYIATIILAIVLLLNFSCTDWLDVKPVDRMSEDQLYSTEAGFRQALNGIYVELNHADLYGDELLVNTVEILAQRYKFSSMGTLTNQYHLAEFDYTTDYAKKCGSRIWEKAYALIANVNKLLKNADSHKDLFTGDSYDLITGEAYALRAFLHFDLLRLFGPVYKTHKEDKSICYNTQFSLSGSDLLPASKVMEYVIADLKEAEDRLAKDPIIEEGPLLSDGATEEEDFWRFRSLRLNYYAVKALQARAYLYAEMNEDALEAARTVVAVQEKWFPFLEYSAIVGNSKTPNRVFSTELLFCMQNTKRNTIFTSYFTPDLKDDQMYVTPKTFLENIFGTLARNDRRYEPIWLSPSNHDFRCFHKYADIESATFYSNLIPMIRVTEMYYIIAETTTDDIEALNSINLVLENRGLDKLTSKDEIPATILSEYQKEFWGEGQLFFYYKRINASSIPSAMTGGDVEMNDVKYSMPLPESETNFR